LRVRFLRERLVRPTGASLDLAALQVLAQGGSEARPLLVVCGLLAAHGINPVPWFNAAITAKSRQSVSAGRRFGQAASAQRNAIHRRQSRTGTEPAG
jgi:hypothetical protein